MSCIPESGGCERKFLDPFITFLNETCGTTYIFQDCLDVRDSTQSQPEALYVDSLRSRRLVVERKTVSWPENFPNRHANDHFVAEVCADLLKQHQFATDLFELTLPLLIAGTKRELRPLAESAASKINSGWSRILAGEVLRDRVKDGWWWTFRKVPDWEKDGDDPTEGLKISWRGPIMQLGAQIEPPNLPPELINSLHKIFKACVKKFGSYPDAERILLLDPCGDLEYKGADWWKAVFLRHKPPADIGAIWSGTFDHEWESWSFERVH